jgi:hypothetical protein
MQQQRLAQAALVVHCRAVLLVLLQHVISCL